MNPDDKIEKAPMVPPFVRFVASAIPMVFDDSLSYYEALCALWKWLQDDVVNVINNNAAVTEDYIQLTKDMKEYMDNYFDNLDVQEEINNKLDEMADDGTLQELINDYLQTNVAWVFDTVADMKASTNLISGSYARTLGFHTAGDGGAGFYKISDTGTANEMDVIAVGSLYATLVVLGDIKPEMFGAYGDGTHNDSTAFTRCLAYTAAKEVTVNNESIGKTIYLTNDYLIDKLSIPQGMAVTRIIGDKARIRTGGFTFNGSTGWKALIKGIVFDTCETPIDFDYRNLEYGRYEVIDCIFRSCTGVSINVERRSCQVIIEGCTFRGCEKTAYFNDCDMVIFRNNWIECTSEHAWSNNHYDIEQYAPNEGSMIIENNMFIPGYSQTATNPCWIKVGRNANIKNNRFSGENATIHPLIIIYDKAASFNLDSTVYPIINFEDNPIVAGNTSILVDGSARGVINIRSNSGWANANPIMRAASADATTALAALDYRYLAINFKDNAGRTFNFRDDKGLGIPSAYAPSVDTVLQRFINYDVTYQGKYNYELKASVESYTLSFEYCTTQIKRTPVFLVTGTYNKNPGGGDYFEEFLAVVTLEHYYDTEYRWKANAQIISKNGGNVAFTAKINGQDYVTALPAGENVQISLVGTGNARVTFEAVEPMNLVPYNNRLSN